MASDVSTSDLNATAWDSSAVYTKDMIVVIDGVFYRANWWTQGTDPSANAGPFGSGLPWTVISGGSDAPATSAWSATSVYTEGMTVTIDGIVYQANWWTQGTDPTTSNGGSGTGMPWTIVTEAPPPTEPDTPTEPALPDAPTGLSATATSENGTVLSWQAASVPEGGTITGYNVFRDGTWIATVTGTSLTVTGLTADTTYQFTVAALDAAGSSSETAALAVTTLAGTTDPTEHPSDVPLWTADSVYTKGMTASVDGVVYQANWWTRGDNPVTANGVLGTGQPWTIVSSGGTPTVPDEVPTAPTGLTASATTETSTVLSWTASAVPGGGTVTGYTILQDGLAIGLATGTSFTVTNLAAGTTYAFSVVAMDAAGNSPASGAVSVMTAAIADTPDDPETGIAAWDPTAVYTQGMTVVVGGVVYRSNWWTQGTDPSGANGAAEAGAPWTAIGAVGADGTLVPTPPSGLSAVGTSGTSTLLTWQASVTPSGDSPSQYLVFADGEQIGVASGTSFYATGLTAGTTYAFSVEAVDSSGTSPASGTLSVTTPTGTPDTPDLSHVFAPYVDMTLNPGQNLLALHEASGIDVFTLAFVVDPGNGFISWGGYAGIEDDTLPGGTLSFQTQIEQLRAAGGDVIISFGGAANHEPAELAGSATELQAIYQSVIDRYHATSLDFDIEGAAVDNQAANVMRDQALVALKAANPGLTISFTLPVLPTGLVESGVNILETAKAYGLDPDVINVMAMDYGETVDSGSMSADAISAALHTIDQIRFVGLTSKVGITPMIGVNDIASEVFTLEDAQILVDFANSNSEIARLSMWSVARDNGSEAGTPYATNDGSGLSQSDYQFSAIFDQFA